MNARLCFINLFFNDSELRWVSIMRSLPREQEKKDARERHKEQTLIHAFAADWADLIRRESGEVRDRSLY